MKADLRARFRARRHALTDADWQQRCQRIAALTIEQLGASPGAVHTFLPIVRQREVDTWPVVRYLWTLTPAARVAISRTDFGAKILIHCWLMPETPLVENRLGIPEPAMGNDELIMNDEEWQLADTVFDVVLVPLLAVDERGQRVGYGGGYYDRFLSQCRPDCRKIGLSLFEPVADIADVWPGDVRLDGVVTPERVYLF
jgi:5-formyltetrahydrofolate cyclo-ligase